MIWSIKVLDFRGGWSAPVRMCPGWTSADGDARLLDAIQTILYAWNMGGSTGDGLRNRPPG